MFSLLVLFTVFVGLVVVLVLSEHCRRRSGGNGGREEDEGANLARVAAWLEERGHTLPPAASVIDLLNRVARRKIQSQDWEDIEVTGLLPDTQLPSLSVLKINQQTHQYIEFQLSMDWPTCLLGVGVKLRRRGRGEEEERGERGREDILCELQVDWMYAQATVRLTDSSGPLLSFKHSRSPQMALSCMVTTEGVKEPDDLASSVAHSLQLMFYELELTGEPLDTSCETRNKEEEEEEEEEEDEEERDRRTSTDLSQNSLPNNHVFNPTPIINVNHNSHTHSQNPAHHNKPHPSSAPLSELNPTPVSTAREGEGEEGERGGEAVIDNGLTMLTVTPVSRKLWQRESLGGVGQKEGEEEEGKGVSVTGEIGEKAEEEEEEERKEEEGEIRKIVSEDSVDTAGAVEEVEKKPDLVESKEEEVPPTTESPTAAAGDDDERAAAGDDDGRGNTTPDNQHLFDVRDSPPSSAHSHPSPLALHTSHPHSEPIAMGSRSKSMSSWRRSPSYEKLQEFVLPSVREGGVASVEGVEAGSSLERLRRPSHQSLVILRRGGGEGEGLLSPNRRRRQTLSMSNSAYSVESGVDEMYPSTLVFEISDSRRTRHIVALSQAHASKLRKRVSHARKLHIYNDHIFVATHLKQRFYCHVCKKKILGFVGKQGYVCRDCNMVVHKHCHYKTEGQCTSSKLSSMNLIYPDSVSTISGL